MKRAPKEIIQQWVAKEQFRSTGEIMEAIKGLFADTLEIVLEAELDSELGYEKQQRRSSETQGKRNYRNGHTRRTVKTELGTVEIAVPRDRNGSFEPQILGRYARSAEGLEDKILSLYAVGLSQQDIAAQVQALYSVNISPELVTRISDRLLPEIITWQSRPLDDAYAFVFLDAVHFKVRDEGRVVSKAAYVVLGVKMDGHKEVLGIWIGDAESSRFWLSVLSEMKQRGVRMIHLFCVDGLTGFKEAIQNVYPQARIQRCIVHQIRSSMKYVSSKDRKAFAQDLKLIYRALNEQEARFYLQMLRETWGKQYPSGVRSWEENWEELTTFFDFPEEIRKIIYTTNAIEGLHRQFRKMTKTKGSFPSEQSLMKLLYCAVQNISKTWTGHYQNWSKVLNALETLQKGDLKKLDAVATT